MTRPAWVEGAIRTPLCMSARREQNVGSLSRRRLMPSAADRSTIAWQHFGFQCFATKAVSHLRVRFRRRSYSIGALLEHAAFVLEGAAKPRQLRFHLPSTAVPVTSGRPLQKLAGLPGLQPLSFSRTQARHPL